MPVFKRAKSKVELEKSMGEMKYSELKHCEMQLLFIKYDILSYTLFNFLKNF